MRKILKEYKSNGLCLKLIKRTDKVALYSTGTIDKAQTYDLWAYEVHIIRISPERVGKFKQPDGSIKENTFEECERLAGKEDFGKYAWTYSKLVNAEKKYNELIAVTI